MTRPRLDLSAEMQDEGLSRPQDGRHRPASIVGIRRWRKMFARRGALATDPSPIRSLLSVLALAAIEVAALSGLMLLNVHALTRGGDDRAAQQAGIEFWTGLTLAAIGLVAILAAALRSMLVLERTERLRMHVERGRHALARSERGRHDLIRVLGHDLRQPLQAIGLFTKGLERRCKDTTLAPMLDGLQSATSSMNRMLSGLVDLSRLDAGTVTVQRADISLAAVIEPVTAAFRTDAESKGLAITADSSALLVHTDPALLEETLRGLVSNAIRYTERGGIMITAAVEEGRVTLSVSDTGIGIARHEQAKVFEDFYRVSDISRGAEGLGIGLGIVRRLARLLELRLELQSDTGRGTTVRLTLPPDALIGGDVERLATKHAAKTGEADIEDELAGSRVLIVDDDEIVCRALRLELESRGMVVSVTHTPEAALTQFFGAPAAFDILLVDRDLQSTLTGPELLKQMAERMRDRPPAVVLSGTADFGVVAELQQLPYVWLAKPVPVTSLLREMHRIVAGQKPPDLGPPASQAGSLTLPARSTASIRL